MRPLRVMVISTLVFSAVFAALLWLAYQFDEFIQNDSAQAFKIACGIAALVAAIVVPTAVAIRQLRRTERSSTRLWRVIGVVAAASFVNLVILFLGLFAFLVLFVRTLSSDG